MLTSPHRADRSTSEFPGPLSLYQRAGGVESCDALAGRLRPHVAQPVSVVAHWLVERKIVAFDWHSRTFIPLFQFSLHDMSPRADVLQVVAMLAPVFDASQLALWFVQPNTALAGATPVERFRREAGCATSSLVDSEWLPSSLSSRH